MRTLCYIAGPFAAPTVEGITRNVRRACALGRLAAERGYSPVVPHAMGTAGVYGGVNWDVETDGAIEPPEVRARALECGVSLARAVGLVDGEFWVILARRAEPTEHLRAAMSSGCQKEYDEWGHVDAAHTWEDWRSAFEAAGLLDVWERA